MKEKRDKASELIHWVILLLIGIFYYFCLGDKGYILGADSAAFINNEVSGYWLYTWFLDACEYLFGGSLYLEMVNIVQGVFALGVSMLVAAYIKSRFQLKAWETLLVYVATFLPYGYSLPQNVATHHVLTEGLSYSLFHLLLLFLLMVFLDGKMYMLVSAAIMVVLLTGVRTQLMLLWVVYATLLLFLMWKQLYKKLEGSIKNAFLFMSVLALVVAIAIVPYMMKIIVRNEVIPQFIHAMSGRTLCTIEYQDIDGMEEKYKGVVNYVYEKIDDNKYREEYFRDGLRRWEDILIATNDNSLLISEWVHEYCDKMEMDEVQREEISQIRYYLTEYLFDKHLDSYMEMTMWLCIQSFVVSIFIHPDSIYVLCHIAALGIYLFAFLLILINRRMNTNSQARIPVILTGFVLGANVIITNLFFYGQQRYVVYTFGFFYISVYILFKDTIKQFLYKGNSYQ